MPVADSAGPLVRVNDVTPAIISADEIPVVVSDGPPVTPIDVSATIVVAPLMAFAVPMPEELSCGPLDTPSELENVVGAAMVIELLPSVP